MKKTSILLFIILLSSCAKKKTTQNNENPTNEGGQCIYAAFKDVAYVSNFKMDENDSLIEVNFSFVNKPPTELLRLRRRELTMVGKDLFNIHTVKDTSKRYMIEGSKISSGSCYPYLIEKVSLK